MISTDGQLTEAPDVGVVIMTFTSYSTVNGKIKLTTLCLPYEQAVDIARKIVRSAGNIPLDKR